MSKNGRKELDKESEYHCPKCGSYDIYDLGERFQCMKCQLTFDKESCDSLEDSLILSVEEKLKITEILKDKTNIFFDD
ncbi:MAG: hypothetical protein BAJALOKI2v1_530025 [Promethearchaeota archaeon]|nr:MAG: hypothetical protein BAJALOKI2v1_530025 [Candidatus Lokiarchaeota archaeon]